MRLPQQVNPGSIVIFAPRYFEEEQEIADLLLQGKVVVVDFKYLDNNFRQRVYSFLEGTIFGIDGRLLTLREDLLMLLPQGALLEGEKTTEKILRALN